MTICNNFVFLRVVKFQMIKKIYILLIILTLGGFWLPNKSRACGTNATKTQTSCCNKQTNDNNQNDCCKNQTPETNNNGCNGKCDNNSCQCQTISFAFNLPFFVTINFENRFATSEKLKFYDTQTQTSSGFYFILVPPNIG